MKKPFILGAIFARGGSKGLPGKNIKELNGKPLIAYAIQAGKSVKDIDALIVSTDDENIASVAKKWGAEIPFMRPAHLATDEVSELLSWQHALQTYGRQIGRTIDFLVSMPTTSPLRKPQDIEQCLDVLKTTDADAVITVTEANHNPYFNMVKMDDQGLVSTVIPSVVPIVGRQKAPRVYGITAVCFAARAEFILTGKRLMEGKVRAVHIPQERAVDIDTPLDFQWAEFLMRRDA